METKTKSDSKSAQKTNLQQTLVLAKPDAVQRGLVGKIVARFEERGLSMVGLRLLQMDEKLAEKLYEPHVGKPFYPPLVEYMTSGPIVAMAWEGVDAIAIVRMMLGATKPAEANPGTIRGDFAQRVDRNIVHGSDSPESAAREIPIFFASNQLVEGGAAHTEWL